MDKYFSKFGGGKKGKKRKLPTSAASASAASSSAAASAAASAPRGHAAAAVWCDATAPQDLKSLAVYGPTIKKVKDQPAPRAAHT